MLKEIDNLLLNDLIDKYAKDNKKETKELIFENIMSDGWFLIPILKEDIDTNTYDVEWISDFQDTVYLPVFTSYYNFLQYKRLKANKVMVCNFKLVLKMFESIENEVRNIVINPTTNELNLTKIDIALLRKNYNTSIYRQDLNSMEIIELPKNKVCSKNNSSIIHSVNIPALFKKELLTIAKFHKSLKSVYLFGTFNKKSGKNEYTIVFKEDKKESCGELHLEEIEKILYEYLNEKFATIHIENYNQFTNKNLLKKASPFYVKQ